MSHSVSKLNPNRSSNQFTSQWARGAIRLQESESRALIDFIVDQYRDIPQGHRLLSEAQHQEARRRVFRRLVSDTLSRPGHPFAGIRGRMREDMIRAITEELVHSHYAI